MFKKKNKQIKISPNKSNLDQVLWLIENFLPQKKNRGVQKNLYMDNLEAETIKKFSKDNYFNCIWIFYLKRNF